MIIKILEEMRQIRIKEDYKNYRTLSDVLSEYLYIEIYNIPINKLTEEKYDKVNIILKWIDSEIIHISECVDQFLKDKDYKNLKITSQSHSNLQKMKTRLEDIKFYYNKNNNLPQFKK